MAGAPGSGGSVWDHVPPQNMIADPAQFSPYVTGDVPFTRVDRDEPVRPDASLDSMAKLRPIDAGGTITAGNAPGVNDGAAALVLSNADYARANGIEPLAEIVDHAGVAWDPPYLALVPAMAAQKLLDQQGLRASDIAVWEINEAFAAVALTAAHAGSAWTRPSSTPKAAPSPSATRSAPPAPASSAPSSTSSAAAAAASASPPSARAAAKETHSSSRSPRPRGWWPREGRCARSRPGRLTSPSCIVSETLSRRIVPPPTPPRPKR